MSRARIFLLWVQWMLLWRRSVVLIDYDGEPNARLVHGYGKWIFAKRHGLGIRKVSLRPDGETEGASYVKSWEPLFG